MTDSEENEWTSEEARALRGLADRTGAPSADAKAKTIGRLATLGLLQSTQSSRRPAWMSWAAAASFAAIGFLAGRMLSPAPAPEPFPNVAGGTKYVLLLTGAGSATPEENGARREEYGAWLKDLQRRGVSADGAELVGTRHEFPEGRPQDGVVGYFVISAKGESEAVAIAKANPHLRHGGGVVVAAIR
jgi:hypothetical protein